MRSYRIAPNRFGGNPFLNLGKNFFPAIPDLAFRPKRSFLKRNYPFPHFIQTPFSTPGSEEMVNMPVFLLQGVRMQPI
jgi:hypothetical protein